MNRHHAPISRKTTLLAAMLVAILGVLFQPIPSRAQSGNAVVDAKITRFGEIVLQETLNGGYTAPESLANLSYAQGAMHWWIAPDTTMLKPLLMLPDYPAALDVSKLDALLQNPPAIYRAIILSAAARPLPVSPVDGTFGPSPPLLPRSEYIRNYFRVMRVREDGAQMKSLTSPAIQKILRRWLEGAQYMASLHRGEFEARYPELRDLKLVDAFLALTEDDLFRSHAAESLLYDSGHVFGTIGLVRSWFVPQTLGTLYTNSQPTGSDISSPGLLEAKGIGASNAAAFTFRDPTTGIRECVAVGEPHLPSTYFGSQGLIDANPAGPNSQAKVSRMLVQDHGVSKPLAALYHSGLLGVPVISASAGFANGLTAGPSGSGFIFFVETNGTHYRGDDGQWHPFEVSSRLFIFDGQEVSVPEYSVPGFGRAIAYIQQPGRSIRHVLTVRLRSVPLTAESILGKVLAGITNDPEEFKRATRIGAAYWGEAGCGPSSLQDAPRLAYAALNQGRPDIVSDPNADSLNINPISPTMRKLGATSTPACFDQRWAVSDNGNLKSGCQTGYTGPTYLDPGFQTTRQLAFARTVGPWGESNVPISASEVERLATDTYGEGIFRLTQIATGVYRRFGHLGIFTGSETDREEFVEDLEQFDGKQRDTTATIKAQYLLKQFDLFGAGQSLPFSYELFTDVVSTTKTPTQVIEEMSLPDAELLVRMLKTTFDFDQAECVPLGSPTWNQISSIEFAGKVVAAGFGGPGADARSTGTWEFKRRPDATTMCAARLTSSSPMKYVSTRKVFRYLPYGPPVSPFSIDPTLHDTAAAAWWALWSQHNHNGEGYGGYNSYREIPLDTDTMNFAPNELLHTFTFQVPESAFTDCDSDGIPDESEPDDDNDGVANDCESCPLDPSKTSPGICGCGAEDLDLNQNGIADCHLKTEFQDATFQLQNTLNKLLNFIANNPESLTRRYRSRIRNTRRALLAFSSARENFLISRPISGPNALELVRVTSRTSKTIKRGLVQSTSQEQLLRRSASRLQRVWRLTLGFAEIGPVP